MPGPFYAAIPVNTPKTFGLGFYARSLVIDNPTSRFLFLPEAQQYIPPYVVGVVINYGAATQNPNIVWQTPPGITAAATIAGQQALLKFTEDNLVPNPGTPITVPVVTAATSIVIAQITQAAGASPQTIVLPTALAIDGDVMYLIIAQDSGGGAAPTIVTPTDWIVPATAPSLLYSNGGRQGRYSVYTKVFHPGIVSAVITYTNTANFIWTFVIVRPVPQATMTDNPAANSAVVAAATFAIPGRALTVGNGQGIVLYAPVVGYQVVPPTLLTATLTGGQTGLTQVVAPLVGTTQTQALFFLQETFLELCPTATFTYSANFTLAGGLCIPIPHA